MRSIKNFAALLALSLALSTTIEAFAPAKTSPTRVAPLNAYVPDGLSLQEYQKIKANDRKKIGKNLGRLGPRGFKSRSMQAWQEAYEKGEAGHAFAPFGYREDLKKGKINKAQVPYMVRGGSWDNSDVSGGRRLKWSKKDREYAKGGYKKEQSASILGSGPGFNWTGEKRDSDKNTKWAIPGLS
jgi:hypothetical protein